LSGNALDQTSVDNFLISLVASGVTPTTVNLTGGTNSTPGAPGLSAISTLTGLGWTITTN
jgi:hypothetical protein